LRPRDIKSSSALPLERSALRQAKLVGFGDAGQKSKVDDEEKNGGDPFANARS
jgi:hypothetical protein